MSLEARLLREAAYNLSGTDPQETQALLQMAAAKIDEMTAETVRLANKAGAQDRVILTGREAIVKIATERDAKLAALEKQEPVAEVDEDDNGLFVDLETPNGTVVKFGQKLYAAAGAAPVPDMLAGWIRACDDEMIPAHLGVANLSDSYESAKAKLRMLIDWHVAVAVDPAVNGGYQLVPVEPTPEMCEVATWDFNRVYAPHEIYKAMLKLAPKEPT